MASKISFAVLSIFLLSIYSRLPAVTHRRLHLVRAVTLLQLPQQPTHQEAVPEALHLYLRPIKLIHPQLVVKHLKNQVRLPNHPQVHQALLPNPRGATMVERAAGRVAPALPAKMGDFLVEFSNKFLAHFDHTSLPIQAIEVL